MTSYNTGAKCDEFKTSNTKAPPTDIGEAFFMRLLRLQACGLKATCSIVVLLLQPVSK